MKKTGLHIHIYCKLIIVLVALIVSFINPDGPRCLYLMSILTVFALIQLQIKNTVYFWVFFMALMALLYAYQYFSWSDDVVSRYSFVIMRNSMPSFLALFILGSTPVSEITSGFDSLHFPKRTGIAVVTMFRYIPTLGNDIKTAHENMKLRGLLNAGKLLMHPLRTVKFFMLPMMVHLYSTAEELAISATTRGAESDKKRTSLYGKKINFTDAVILAVMVPGLLAVLLI